ncbi:MAG TPA: PQQ-binding-like beta-propeller repeat protein [Pirellulaceae bacterium]|nr:PQQ-binding-like beta-propeller repeat protein [Pirellulaceae bacterium]HMO91446.1 PQQ-binding-like beta-propeller repeat protein [Pirellulaceae bacterium]HMP69477.1 PQQ-binding-like beta-propeller repeat protein [Pirellulaceae bacterium]
MGSNAINFNLPKSGVALCLLGTIFLILTNRAEAMFYVAAGLASPVSSVETRLITSMQDEDEAEPTERSGEEGSGKYLGGAALKTDPDLVALLQKAEQYQKDGNYQVAARYWQTVLERSGDTLYSNNGETYYAMTEQVELILARLPEEGLRAYRISADANALEIMAQAKGNYDVETLSKLVRLYFMSSLGDEAAFRLAGIFMDQFDFVAAARLLKKIVEQYPQPKVPMADVWLRLAITYTYLGDSTSAQSALNQARDIGGASSAVIREIQTFVDSSPTLVGESIVSNNWTMTFGGPRRLGVMKPLPSEYLEHDLAPIWQYAFEPSETFDESNYAGVILAGDDATDPKKISESVSPKEANFVNKWRENKWRPAGGLLIYDEAVVFKTGSDLTAWALDPGDRPLWRPLWLNRYVEDESSRGLRQMMEAYGRSGRISGRRPNDSQSIQYFQDRVHQSTSIYRGNVLNVEGEHYSHVSKARSSRQSARGFQYGQLPKRGRTNFLTAYNLQTGKLIWRQPPVAELTPPINPSMRSETSDETVDLFADVCFLAAPVGVGELILAPVMQGGAIHLYALNVATGQLVWRSFLCDDPSSGGQAYSPIEISVEGSSAYVTCGTGVLFAIDPLTGIIQYARRYERTGVVDNSLQNIGITGQMIMDGWEHDLVIPYGNILLMFSSDYSSIWAIDRQTTKFVWRTDNRPFNSKFEYLIGIYGDKIYLGGSDSIAAVSIPAQGRWEWIEEFNGETSYGRAFLTEDGIYVPIEDSIAHYSLDGNKGRGNLIARVGVRQGLDAPVGNLFSDGRKIWVVGASRLMALGKAPEISTSADDPFDDEDAAEVDAADEQHDEAAERDDDG